MGCPPVPPTGQMDTHLWLELYLCELFTRWFTWVVLLDLRRLFMARDPASSCREQGESSSHLQEEHRQAPPPSHPVGHGVLTSPGLPSSP